MLMSVVQIHLSPPRHHPAEATLRGFFVYTALNSFRFSTPSASIKLSRFSHDFSSHALTSFANVATVANVAGFTMKGLEGICPP
jgi:hypothetical protein